METKPLSEMTDDQYIAHCRTDLDGLTIGAMIEFERREDRVRELAPDIAGRVDGVRRDMAKKFDAALKAQAASLTPAFDAIRSKAAQLPALGMISLEAAKFKPLFKT